MKGKRVMLTRYVVMMVAGLVANGSLAHAETTTDKAGPVLKGVKCMLCNMPVKKEAVVEYMDAKVYFGCAACPAQFRKNMAKFASKANAQLVATEQAQQKACPFTGKPKTEDAILTVGDADVAFCCPKCKSAVTELKAEAQVARVFNDKAFMKAFKIAKPKEAHTGPHATTSD